MYERDKVGYDRIVWYKLNKKNEGETWKEWEKCTLIYTLHIA